MQTHSRPRSHACVNVRACDLGVHTCTRVHIFAPGHAHVHHTCVHVCTCVYLGCTHMYIYVHLNTHMLMCSTPVCERMHPTPGLGTDMCAGAQHRQAWFAHRGMCKHTRYMWTSEAECTHTSVHYTRASTPNPCSWWRRTEWQIPPALKNLGGVRNKPLRCMKVMLCFSQFPGRCEVLPVSFKLGQTETSRVSWTRQPGLAGFVVLRLLCLGCMASPCLYGYPAPWPAPVP